MSQKGKGRAARYVAFVAPSLIGLIILIGLSFSFPSPTLPFQREISTLAFITICFLGAIAGLYPAHMRRLFRKTTKSEKVGPGYPGHHPSCGKFETHVIRFRGKVLCAGCTGLFIGAGMGVIVTLYTYFYPIQTLDFVTLTAGVLLTTIGIFQHAFGRDPRLHLALNVALVIGVALARIGAIQLNRGLVVDAYAVALSLYLIVARIDLSRDDHENICGSCDSPCELSFSTNHKLSISDN